MRTLVLSMLACVTLITALPASAAAGAADRQAQLDRLVLSPPRVVVSARAGTRYVTTLTFRNQTADTFTVYLDALDLQAADDPGSFAELSRTRTTASWFELPFEDRRVAAGAKLQIPVRISVPADARPGVHAAAVVVKRVVSLPGSSTEGGARIAVSASVASQFVLSVPGQLRTNLQIEDLTGPRLVLSGDDNVSFRATLANEGDTFVRVENARVGIGAFTGRAQQDLRLPAVDLLPDGRRDLRVRWRDRPLFGWFRPTLFLDVNGTRQRADFPLVFVLPPWWVLVALAGAVALPLAVWLRRRRSRRQIRQRRRR